MKTTINKMAGRVDAISINQRFLKMETQLNAIQNGLDAMDKNPAVTLEHLEAAKTELTQNTSEGLKKLAVNQVDILDQRLQKESSKLTAVTMQNANVLTKVNEQMKKNADTTKDMEALKKLVADLLRRVKALEEDIEE